MMRFNDLQDFARELERRGELRRITVQVDRELEISEIYDRVVKRGGEALLFERVAGSPYPLIINAFGTERRMALALGANVDEGEGLDDIARRIANLIDPSRYSSLAKAATRLPGLAKAGLSLLPKTRTLPSPCAEVVENDVDLYRIPALKCWPGDAGPFFTLPLVFTKNPDSGSQNVGMYRLQIHDAKSTGMHWHLHKDGRSNFERYRARGEKMPVAVALGCDPAMIYAATAPLPPFIDEALFAGFLRGSPVEMTRTGADGIKVPAHAEFVLEGYVDPSEELKVEGPFGDHTGYYSLAAPYPVFHVTRVTHKRAPLFNATVVGRPPMEDCFMARATTRIFLPIIKAALPEIVDIDFPLEGVFHGCAIVSIEKRFPGHARKAMHGLWGMGQMMYTKTIIVVDRDVDPRDHSKVAWKAFNNVDPRRDIVIDSGPLDALDHASPDPYFGGRLGIDATRKLPEEGHPREWPDDIAMNPEVKAKVDARWKEYGFDA